MKKGAYFILFCVLCIGCHKSEFTDDYPDTPQGNFEAFWNIFDKGYCSFSLKNVDWQACYTQFSGQITASSSDDLLFIVFSQMLSKLKDGHVSLNTSSNKVFYYDLAAGKSNNFLGINIATAGITSLLRDNSSSYGIFPENIGYINISNWSQEISIDKILFHLKDTKGLIIDIRNNGGGSDLYTDPVVSRFTDKTFTGSYYRWKKGPGHNDFGEFLPRNFKPRGSLQYVKPVIILINRRCFSATEDFLLNMKQLSNVKSLGDTTGGGAGNPLLYFLPNKWVVRVPRALTYNINKETFEGKGIAPDILTSITVADSIASFDRIVKRAIEFLK